MIQIPTDLTSSTQCSAIHPSSSSTAPPPQFHRSSSSSSGCAVQNNANDPNHSCSSKPFIISSATLVGTLDDITKVFEEYFEVLDKIGKGAFGSVYQCRIKNCNESFPYDRGIQNFPDEFHDGLCVKVVDERGKRKPTLFFGSEEYIVHQLNFQWRLKFVCPYIVRYYDFCLHNQQLFIIMEACTGPNLRELLEAKAPVFCILI